MEKKRKRKVSNMAWDYPLFRQRYQWDCNPGIEPTRLSKEDKETFLIYIHQDGTETNYTVQNFFDEKLWAALPAVSNGILMAMDYPEFRDTFQPENNLSIDPYTLKKRDSKTHLFYINKYGIESNYTPKRFFDKRLWERMPYKRKAKGRNLFNEIEMAMDYKEFRDTFQQENNPGVDPYTLKKWRDYTPLIYINEYGVATNYTPARFFNERLWETMPYKKPEYEMAMDYKEFRDIFQQENNPGVDPYTLKKWRDYTPLIYINEYGVVTNYTPARFFNERLWETMPYRKYEMAMDYKEFRATFQQENNIGVDPYILRKWYDYTPLIYINQHGILINYCPNDFFQYKMWKTMPHIKKEKSKKEFKHTTHEMAMDYEEFRDFFQPENNPGIDPYTLKKWRDYTPLIHINQYGVVTPYTPHYFFHKRIWEYVPYRQYKPGETVNALALDEDLALYVKTEKDREKLLNTGVHTKKAFHCPFCGYEFSKKLIDMINCSPKCPFCNDTGMYEEASDDEINGAYLKRT